MCVLFGFSEEIVWTGAAAGVSKDRDVVYADAHTHTHHRDEGRENRLFHSPKEEVRVRSAGREKKDCVREEKQNMKKIQL